MTADNYKVQITYDSLFYDRGELKAFRRKFNLSQREIQLILGLSDERTVRRWEGGGVEISGPTRLALRYMNRHGLDAEAMQALAEYRGTGYRSSKPRTREEV